LRGISIRQQGILNFPRMKVVAGTVAVSPIVISSMQEALTRKLANMPVKLLNGMKTMVNLSAAAVLQLYTVTGNNII